jgi:hypothetical protein
LTAAAGLFDDDDLAKGIDDYGAILVKIVTSSKDFADAAIAIAKVIEQLDDITFDQVLLGASIGFNVGHGGRRYRPLGSAEPVQATDPGDPGAAQGDPKADRRPAQRDAGAL